MAKKLYVGNLSYQTTEDGLRTAFEQAGEVETILFITDRETGRPKGFAFVEMKDEAGAKAAEAMWHEKELDGRKLIVNEARPQKPREDRGGGGGGGRW